MMLETVSTITIMLIIAMVIFAIFMFAFKLELFEQRNKNANLKMDFLLLELHAMPKENPNAVVRCMKKIVKHSKLDAIDEWYTLSERIHDDSSGMRYVLTKKWWPSQAEIAYTLEIPGEKKTVKKKVKTKK